MAKNKIYAVIDTNVIVSALLSKNSKSSTSIVYEAIPSEAFCGNTC